MSCLFQWALFGLGKHQGIVRVAKTWQRFFLARMVVVVGPKPKKKNIDIHCVIKKYLKKNMKNFVGFVGVVKEVRFNEDFLRQRVFRRFDNCKFLFDLAER